MVKKEWNEEEKQCKIGCPKEKFLESISKLSCNSANDSMHALVLAAIAIIVSVVGIILHFA